MANTPSIKSMVTQAADNATDARGILRLGKFSDAIREVRDAIKEDRAPTNVMRGYAALGEHVERVMLDAGFSKGDIREFWRKLA